MSNDKMRDEFDSWIEKQGMSTMKDGETYYHRVTHVAWQAWKASRAAPAVQGKPLRYTNDGALVECPCCGSIDVGGAHDTVSCYSCDLTVTKPRPLQNAIDAWNTRTGRTHPAPAVQGEPVGYIRRSAIEIMEGDELGVRANIIKEPRYRDCVALYTAPQPAEQQPEVTQLVEALEKARDAIASLPKDALGNVPDTQQCQGRHIRDELINDISTALAAHRKGDQP